jgi:hypothetical protein
VITPEQRRKWEGELNSDERSIVAIGRFMKGAVLALLVVGLFWIGNTDDKLNNAPEASAAARTLASSQAEASNALRTNADLGQNAN